MAEQKIDDTKAPAAPRGARPFAGPAAPSAARPFLRPVAPAARPSGAPCAPPSGTRPSASRPSLGVAVPSSRPAPVPTPVAVQTIENAVPNLRPTEVGSFGITQENQASGTPVPVPSPEYDSAPEFVAAQPAVVVPEIDDVPAVEKTQPAALESPRRVTSEMVALDAFDAFEAVWGGSDTGGSAAPPAPPPSPLDPVALGSGSDGECLWADEASAAAEPARLADDDTVATAGQPTGAWSEMAAIPSADDVIAVSLVDDAITVDDVVSASSSDQTLGAEPAAADAWPDQLLAEYAPYAAPSCEIPTDVDAVTTDEPVAHVTTPAIGMVAVPEVEHSLADPVHTGAGEALEASRSTEANASAGTYVSATLDRLAERVRRGEIDISSVAPDATEAAVLASVLATLLGGSNSR